MFTLTDANNKDSLVFNSASWQSIHSSELCSSADWVNGSVVSTLVTDQGGANTTITTNIAPVADLAATKVIELQFNNHTKNIYLVNATSFYEELDKKFNQYKNGQEI